MKQQINFKDKEIIKEIINGIEQSAGIYFISSFIMESGIKILKPYLKKACERGAEIKILTGDYLFVTQPAGLNNLIEIDENIVTVQV